MTIPTTTFSVDMHDNEGDRFVRGVLLHLDQSVILRFDSSDDIELFANKLLGMLPEVREHEANRR